MPQPLAGVHLSGDLQNPRENLPEHENTSTLRRQAADPARWINRAGTPGS